MEGITVY